MDYKNILFIIFFLIILQCFLSFGTLDLNNLKSYYDFEQTGNTIYDIKNYNSNGTVTSFTCGVSGKLGNSCYNDTLGGSAKINMSVSDFPVGNSDFTYNMWIKDETTTFRDYYDLYFSYGTLSSSQAFIISLTDASGNIMNFNNNQDGVNFAGLPRETSWHMITITYNGATKNITSFYNGTRKQSAILSQNQNTQASNDFIIGANSVMAGYGSTNVNFWIDELSVWNETLSENQVQELFNIGDAYNPLIIQNTSDLTTKLVAYYNCDESLGNLTDSLGNYNMSEAGGNTGNQTGIIKGSRGNFNGNVFVSSSYYPFSETQKFTLSMWVYALSNNPSNIVLYTNDHETNTFFYDLYTNGGNLIFQAGKTGGDLAQCQYSDGIVAGNWYHLVSVFNKTTLSCYVNNVSQTSAAYTSGATTGTTNKFRLGNAAGSTNPNDQDADEFYIDEIALYNRTLNQTEISQLYYDGLNNISYPFSSSSNPISINNINLNASDTNSSIAYWDTPWLTCTFNMTNAEYSIIDWYKNYTLLKTDYYTPTYCINEFANVSNCGQTITGTYEFYIDYVNINDTLNWTDGNDNTSFAVADYGTARVNVNYSLPSNYDLLQWKFITNESELLFNLTSNSDCIYNNTLVGWFSESYNYYGSGYYGLAVGCYNYSTGSSFAFLTTKPSVSNVKSLREEKLLIYSNSTKKLNSTNYTVDDIIYTKITAYNGSNNVTGYSNNVTILGSYFNSSIISNTTGFVYNTTILCNYTGEHIKNVTIQWYKNDTNIYNETISNNVNQSSLPNQYITNASSYYCKFYSYPYQNESWSYNKSINISNLKEPMINSVNITNSTSIFWDVPSKSMCSYSFLYANVFSINWFVNNILNITNNENISNSNYKANKTLICQLNVSAGGMIIIQNSTQSIILSGVNISFLNITNDTTKYLNQYYINYTTQHTYRTVIQWLQNGIENTNYQNLTYINTSSINSGENITVIVKAYDNADFNSSILNISFIVPESYHTVPSSNNNAGGFVDNIDSRILKSKLTIKEYYYLKENTLNATLLTYLNNNPTKISMVKYQIANDEGNYTDYYLPDYIDNGIYSISFNLNNLNIGKYTLVTTSINGGQTNIAKQDFEILQDEQTYKALIDEKRNNTIKYIIIGILLFIIIFILVFIFSFKKK